MSAGTWLLLRGLTREAGHWGDFLPLLAAQLAPAAVVALDLPGAGARWEDDAPLSIAAITEDLRARAVGLAGPLRLLGLSMGGMVAADWAARHPEQLAAVMLVNTSMRPHGLFSQRLRPAAWPALLAALAGADAVATEGRILRLTSSRHAEHAALLPGWVALRRRHPVTRRTALLQLTAAARYTAAPSAPAVPLHLVCSARDAVVDPACTQALANAWQLPVSVHPEAGHDLPLDAPQWLVSRAIAIDEALGLRVPR